MTAKAPHDPRRPESKAVSRALENDDIDALVIALTPRQRNFCHEYVVDYNATAAAIRAGYSTKHPDRYGHMLIHNRGIARYIDHLSQSKEAKIIAVDPDYLIAQVVAVITKEGVSDSNKLRALELLMKHKGMFVERQEISGPDGKAIEIDRKNEEDASAVIETLRRMGRPDLKVVGD